MRTRGTNCPFCQGKSLCRHSSLATKAPRQTRYWNQGKNVKTPEQMFAGSQHIAEWKCPICSQEWQARIASRVQDDSTCPQCSRINSSGNTYTQPTFEAARHPLLMDWDYERNTKDDIHPQNITLGSRKLVHWICHMCPKGELHRYQAQPANRTKRQASKCPYCAGKKVCKCNSLATHDPLVSSECDFEMNDLTPAYVTSRSNKLVWWKNNVRGSWQQRVTDRTDPRLDKPKRW